MKIPRFVRLIGLLAIGIWLGRLAAHAGTPPPEGRWRELTPDQLA